MGAVRDQLQTPSATPLVERFFPLFSVLGSILTAVEASKKKIGLIMGLGDLLVR